MQKMNQKEKAGKLQRSTLSARQLSYRGKLPVEVSELPARGTR